MTRRMSSDPNSSPDSPPPSQWHNSLEHLLNSSTGKNLFLEYLQGEDEGLSVPMLFLLAVEGLRAVAEEDDSEEDKKLISSINLIYDKLLPSVTSVSQRTRERIRRKIEIPVYDVSLYDEAVEEVRDYLSQNLYPNFLKSELYLDAINHEYGRGDTSGVVTERVCSLQLQNESTMHQAQEEQPQPGTSAASYQRCDLQTVHEEEMLSFKGPKPFLTEKVLLSTQWERAKKGTGSGPLNPYHAQYSSYNPVSRQDSEVQSLSSGCTDASIGDNNTSHRRVRHPRRAMPVHEDDLPRVPTHVALPKREGYTQFTLAEKDPETFSRELIQKLAGAARLSPEERLPKNLPRLCYCCCQLFISIAHQPSCQHYKKSVLSSAIDGRILETQLKKLGESNQFVEEPEHDQNILDQHVRRVWNETPPELSRSPRNEAVALDPRRGRRGHGSTAVPHGIRAHSSSAAASSHSIRSAPAALIKGKSMQTLDSGIGGDKGFHDYRNFVRVRLPPRLTNPTEQYVDSGMSDAGDPDYSRQSGLDRPRSGELSRRGPQTQPLSHRRQSPPTEDTVSVLVHYESEHEKPFRIKIPKTRLTLGFLKSKVPKKGNWRYLFKLEDATDKNKHIHFELKRDEDSLPVFRECVFVILKSMHPPEASNLV